MAGEKDYITNVKFISSGKVTFGNGASGTIVRNGTLNFLRLPTLEDLMLVEGFATNLISISQQFDQGLNLKFTKDKCIVTALMKKHQT